MGLKLTFYEASLIKAVLIISPGKLKNISELGLGHVLYTVPSWGLLKINEKTHFRFSKVVWSFTICLRSKAVNEKSGPIPMLSIIRNIEFLLGKASTCRKSEMRFLNLQINLGDNFPASLPFRFHLASTFPNVVRFLT